MRRLTTVTEITGLAAVVVGVGAFDWRAGSVVGGVLAVAWSVLADRGGDS